MIPGSVPVNSTMDSEDRFYATIFLGYRIALIWSAGGVEQKTQFVYFLAAVFFAGGVARIGSMLDVGLPDPFFVAMTILELIIPIGMAFTQHRIANDSDAY